MPNLRRRAVLTVLIASILAEALLGALSFWIPQSDAAALMNLLLNLPGTIAMLLLVFAAGSYLPSNAEWVKYGLIGFAVLVSIGTWTGLTAYVFRKDRSEALVAWHEAILVRPFTIFALGVFLGTAIWMAVALGGDGDAALSVMAFLASIGLVAFAWSKER